VPWFRLLVNDCHHGGPGSIAGWSLCELWCKKWKKGQVFVRVLRFLSGFFGFPLFIAFHHLHLHDFLPEWQAAEARELLKNQCPLRNRGAFDWKKNTFTKAVAGCESRADWSGGGQDLLACCYGTRVRRKFFFLGGGRWRGTRLVIEGLRITNKNFFLQKRNMIHKCWKMLFYCIAYEPVSKWNESCSSNSDTCC